MTSRAGHSRSLIVGATGQVGQQIMRAVNSNHCIPTTRKPLSPEWLRLDLASIDRETALKLLDPFDLDAIYCAGGMTNVEACEEDKEVAMLTNCSGPMVLSEIANERKIPFIYFSTEYIFDGKNGPYDEDSRPNPISSYGLSKWRGEQAVLEICSNSLILRTTVVYGPDAFQKNFLYSLKRALTSGTLFRVPQDQISTPTYNWDLARAAVRLVENGATGIFNVCGPELHSRLEFARIAAQFWGLDPALILGVPTSSLGQKARRPLIAGLPIKKLLSLYPKIYMGKIEESLLDWAQSEQKQVSIN